MSITNAAGNGKTTTAERLVLAQLLRGSRVMKRLVFSENEIIRAVEQYVYADVSPELVCSRLKIRRETLDRWCRRYALYTWAEALCDLKSLRRENRRLKETLARLNKPSSN